MISTPQSEDKPVAGGAPLESSVSMTTLVVAMLASIVVSVFSAWMFLKPVPTHVTDHVRVLDMAKLSVDLVLNTANEAEAEAKMQEAFAALSTMSQQGVVILKSEDVLMAPDTLFLTAQDLLGDDFGKKQ